MYVLAHKLTWRTAVAEPEQHVPVHGELAQRLRLGDDALPSGEDLHSSSEFVALCESQLALLPCIVRSAGLRASVCAPAACHTPRTC